MLGVETGLQNLKNLLPSLFQSSFSFINYVGGQQKEVHFVSQLYQASVLKRSLLAKLELHSVNPHCRVLTSVLDSHLVVLRVELDDYGPSRHLFAS